MILFSSNYLSLELSIEFYYLYLRFDAYFDAFLLLESGGLGFYIINNFNKIYQKMGLLYIIHLFLGISS